MTFPEKLDLLMRRGGLTQTSLGAKLGVSQRAVGKWLAGDSEPNPTLAVKLAAEVGVTYDELFDDAADLPVRHIHEQANAHDEQDAEVIRGSAPMSVSDARALAQQLRDLANKIDPDHQAARQDVGRLKAEVDQAVAAPPAKSRRPAS